MSTASEINALWEYVKVLTSRVDASDSMDYDGVTYYLSREGNKVYLRGSDGSSTYVDDNVRLISEVDTTKTSDTGCLYIDISTSGYPVFYIGDGKAYIVDLPPLDVRTMQDTVSTLRNKSITADVSGETLLLSCIYEG